MESTTLAYLAGAMDSDGFFSIKKDTYHLRVRKDAVNPLYHERIGLKQVSLEIPALLRQTFGGAWAHQAGGTDNSKSLFGYDATDLNAAKACSVLLPYLRVKRRQAEAILELRAWKENRPAHHLAWWWVQEHPDWKDAPLLTTQETAALLGYADPHLISQALKNGTLVGISANHNSHSYLGRFPEGLVRELSSLYRNRKWQTPPQLIAKYENLYQTVRELNRIGTGHHPISDRTGPYVPLARPN